MIEVQSDDEREVVLIAEGRAQMLGSMVTVESAGLVQLMVLQQGVLVGSVSLPWTLFTNYYQSSGENTLQKRLPLYSDITQDIYQEEYEDGPAGSISIQVVFTNEFMKECAKQQQEQTARIAMDQQQLQQEKSTSIRRDNLAALLNQPLSTPLRDSSSQNFLFSSIPHAFSKGPQFTGSILNTNTVPAFNNSVLTNNPGQAIHSFSCNEFTTLTFNQPTVSQVDPPAARPPVPLTQDDSTLCHLIFQVQQQLQVQSLTALANRHTIEKINQQIESLQKQNLQAEDGHQVEVNALQNKILLQETRMADLSRQKQSLVKQEQTLIKESSTLRGQIEESQQRHNHLQVTHSQLAKQNLQNSSRSMNAPTPLDPILTLDRPEIPYNTTHPIDHSELKAQKIIYSQSMESLREARLQYLQMSSQQNQQQLSQESQRIISSLHSNLTMPQTQALQQLEEHLVAQNLSDAMSRLESARNRKEQLMAQEKNLQEIQQQVLDQKRIALQQGQDTLIASQESHLDHIKQEEQQRQQRISSLLQQLGDLKKEICQQNIEGHDEKCSALMEQLDWQGGSKKKIMGELFQLERHHVQAQKEVQRLDTQIRFISGNIDKQEQFIQQMIGAREREQQQNGEENQRLIEEQVGEWNRQHHGQQLREQNGQQGVYQLGQKKLQMGVNKRGRLVVMTGGGWMEWQEYLGVMHQAKE